MSFLDFNAVRLRSRRRAGIARTAALAGAAAVTLLTGVAVAGPASAAETKTWERLAECESDGDWDTNTGNGYYGGLQFSDGTWDAFGGEKFAGLAHKASKAEQIRIAEKILDEQGWDAWPSCSSELGLDDSDAKGTPEAMEDGKADARTGAENRGGAERAGTDNR